MSPAATIENGFAVIDAGTWLVGRGQPAAFFGEVVRRRRKGWFLRDRPALERVDTTGRAFFADAARPFLTYIPCASPITAVSAKVLLAPASARTGAELVKVVPMSVRHSICVTRFGQPEEDARREPQDDTNASRPTVQQINDSTVQRFNGSLYWRRRPARRASPWRTAGRSRRDLRPSSRGLATGRPGLSGGLESGTSFFRVRRAT